MKMFKEEALKETITVKELRDYLNKLIRCGEGDCKIIKVLDSKDVNPDEDESKQNYEEIWSIVPLYQDLTTEGKPYII